MYIRSNKYGMGWEQVFLVTLVRLMNSKFPMIPLFTSFIYSSCTSNELALHTFTLNTIYEEKTPLQLHHEYWSKYHDLSIIRTWEPHVVEKCLCGLCNLVASYYHHNYNQSKVNYFHPNLTFIQFISVHRKIDPSFVENCYWMVAPTNKNLIIFLTW
jgi:hypothetical protein